MPTALTDQIKRAIEKEYHRKSDSLIGGICVDYAEYMNKVGYLGGLAEAVKILDEETARYLRTDDD